ncbi:ankyrin repeat-containing domain protein, partial [Phyllosticta citriasiana]
WSIVHPNIEVCRYILRQADCRPDVVDDEGETPLHWLLHVDNASPEIAKMLIDHGAPVCAKDNHNQQPLYEAARIGNSVIGKMLLRHNACIDEIENTRLWTALHQAVSKGHIDFVEMLLQHDPGPDISVEDNRSRTALHLPAKYGHSGILEAILKYLASDLRTNTEEHPADSDRGTQAHLQTGKDSSDKINAL